MAALLCSSCTTVSNLSDSQIVAGVTLGANAGFRAITGSKRHDIANYVKIAAGTVKVYSSQAPTPTQLSDALNAAIPQQYRDKYSTEISFVIPLVVSEYKTYYDKFSTDHQKLVQVLNAIATGLEAAASQY